jgi:glycosyltransferase involved in cell wall biosynthesis
MVCSTLAASGAEKQFATLAQGLRDRGFGPSVLTLNHRGPHFDELVAAGIPASCACFRTRFDLARAIRAVRQSLAPRPDAVITQSVNAHVVGRAVATLVRRPHLTIEHGGLGIVGKPHHRLWYRLVAPRAALAFAVDESQVPQLVRRGYRPERIEVVPNGIVPLLPARTRKDVRADLGVGDEDFVALLVATLRPEKRADEFLEIVVDAARREPRIRGIVAGGGPGRAALERQAEGCDGVVRVLGERRDVPDLLAASDVLCLTSRAEGLPVAILEAMSAARPVLATDVGGIATAVRDGVNGVLVPAGARAAFVDALVDLAENRLEAGRLGSEGRRLFEQHFTANRMVDAYVASIERVLEDRGR